MEVGCCRVLFQTGGRMKYTGLGLPKLSHVSDVLDHLPFYSWLQGGSLLHSIVKTKSPQKPSRPFIVCTSWLATFPLWSPLWLFLLHPSQPPHHVSSWNGNSTHLKMSTYYHKAYSWNTSSHDAKTGGLSQVWGQPTHTVSYRPSWARDKPCLPSNDEQDKTKA